MKNERILDLLWGWASFYDNCADFDEVDYDEAKVYESDAFRIAQLYQEAAVEIEKPDFNMAEYLMRVVLPELQRG